MARIVIENLSKGFSGPHGGKIGAVKQLGLTVESGEFVSIVGISGCGKTTTLRLIAGLETPDGGTISLDGKSLEGIPARDRDMAMVFQHHALFPHLTVFENMGFGLMLRKAGRAEIEARVKAAAETLHLTELLQRKPSALSGGECQRVALGRALARKPKVFLFDEPLSNLDAPMRLELRGAIADLRRTTGATMIFVTHDQSEAMALADRIAVMKDGTAQQVAAPMSLYRQPANRFVAGFIGAPAMNFFEGQVVQNNGAVVFEKLSLPLDARHAKTLSSHVGQIVTMGLRPEHIAQDEQGKVKALVKRVEPAGPESLLYLSSDGYSFMARQPSSKTAWADETMALKFDMSEACFFDPATGAAIE